MRRVLAGMSQERLGDALGLTFQQVQKYEKGTNRIGASRLQQIAGVLNVSPAFFFEEMETPEAAESRRLDDDGSGFVVDFLSTTEGLVLNKNFVRIRDPKVRRKLVELVSCLAGEPAES
jgi:transcriptional regulator with XRE-family HTH domain